MKRKIVPFVFAAAMVAAVLMGGCGNSLTEVKAEEPTCTEAGHTAYYTDGEKYYSDAEGKNEISPESVAVAALGHNYTPSYSWDGTEATVTLTCERNSSHTRTEAMTVTSETTDATCVDGKTVYTAAVTIDGKEYKDVKEVTLPATEEHSLPEDYLTSATEHWKVCARTGCDEISTKVKHNFDNGDCECGKEAPAPEVPEHFAAHGATCGEAGNIEYWTLGGKYYSDEACTTEITEAETVVAATGEHTPAAEYTKEEGKHYHLCTVCEKPADEKEDHDFMTGTCTVCQKTNGFENTGIDGALTREDTPTSVKVTVGATSADYEAKFYYILSGLDAGQAYVVKYKLTSTVAGNVTFETYGDNKNTTYNIAVTTGEQILTVYGVLRNQDNTTAVLGVGNLAGAVLEFTSISCQTLTLDNVDVDSYKLVTSPLTQKDDDTGEDVVVAPIEAEMTKKDGWFNITSTKGPADAWRIKLEHNLSVEEGKVYDMVYVIQVNKLDKNENLAFEMAAGNFATNNLYWLDKSGDKVVVKFRFTANKTEANQYSNLQLGNLSTQDGEGFDLAFCYIGLIEVA